MKHKIYLAKFAFVDNPKNSKYRPVVALTNSCSKNQLTVCAFVSSAVNNIEEFDILVQSKDVDFEVLGLNFDSVIKLSKLQTISKVDFVNEIGVLTEDLKVLINSNLKSLFEI